MRVPSIDEAYSAADIGRAIKRLRRKRGMTQATLAEWCGVSRQTVVSMEQGGPVAMTLSLKALALLGAKIVVAPKSAILGDVSRP